ncbi:hypothetical protein B0T21DRAFT_362512 [Apiosordaria backusii]|uniref:NACHT domain-containing protein n=1 Tax=Apiosordaria backusii TaxID=314023 RepID=A0AA40BS75_9PEZI|nr:hypothetical protein B0T21DRAFT_362512 [Apiosordaria backusii]
MSSSTPADPFNEAKERFKKDLKNAAVYDQVLQANTIHDVYKFTNELQEKQAKTGSLRNLSKIQRYLEKLNHYASAVDTFVQVKPEILALIWGPIKLIIQWTSTLTQSLDTIINTTAEIGNLLPEFTEMGALFGQNKNINEFMALFYQDILDFYVVSLKFFSNNVWQFSFEALWPRQKGKIEIVKRHVERHASMMRTTILWEHIKDERKAMTQALDDIEKAERERVHQEFHRFKTDISPQFYYRELDAISGKLCEGTGKWLWKADKLNPWLEAGQSAKRVWWLEGIPGAGKTFLSGTVINELQKRQKIVIYAFLSYRQATGTSALSVLHSIIFQMAAEPAVTDELKEALQSIICQPNSGRIRSNLDSACGLLKQILVHVKEVVYFVLDGVDEIEKIERQRLLSQLVQLCKDCDTFRVLISSRVETDIEHTLRALPRMRVDNHNSGSIQAFVKRRSSEWLTVNGFGSQERKNELDGILAPVASQAQGMFLYARIILECLDLCADFREVRQELQVLPANLNEAYGRILKRINALQSPRARTKARNLLGFVGSSPAPLTIFELAQLLSLELDSDKTDGLVRPPLTSFNPVQLCGPIVEVVDEHVQFVHFTVKEYLFSPDIEGSFGDIDMTAQLAKSCLHYMCHDHHDPDLTDDEVKTLVQAGSYRLHIYAETMWFSLIERCLTASGPDSLLLKPLIEALENFSSQTFAGESECEDGTPSPIYSSFISKLRQFKDQLPDAYPLLVAAARFRQQCVTSSTFQISDGKLQLPIKAHINGKTNLETGERWTTLHPLNTSELTITIYQTFDKLLCAATTHTESCCQYLPLSKLYGTRLFKCPYLLCPFRRKGFTTRAKQRSHTKDHDKPWKCDVDGCEYAEIGFLSRQMRANHLLHFHQNDQKQQQVASGSVGHLEEDEIQPLLFDLVREDFVREVHALLPRFEKMPNEVQKEITRVAATSGSAAMFELFETYREFVNAYDAETENLKYPGSFVFDHLAMAARAGNLEVVHWLSEKIKTIDRKVIREKGGIPWEILLAATLQSDSEDVFQALLPALLLEFSDRLNELTVPRAYSVEGVMNSFAISATNGSTCRAEWLLFLWEQLPIQSSAARSEDVRHGLSNCLRDIACYSWSIPLAKAVLGYGADIDDSRHNSSEAGFKTATALRCALRKNKPEAAEFAKFLLYRGADPDFVGSKRIKKKIEQEVGARNLSKWLTVTWEELLAQVKADREAGFCPPEYL